MELSLVILIAFMTFDGTFGSLKWNSIDGQLKESQPLTENTKFKVHQGVSMPTVSQHDLNNAELQDDIYFQSRVQSLSSQDRLGASSSFSQRNPAGSEVSPQQWQLPRTQGQILQSSGSSAVNENGFSSEKPNSNSEIRHVPDRVLAENGQQHSRLQYGGQPNIVQDHIDPLDATYNQQRQSSDSVQRISLNSNQHQEEQRQGATQQQNQWQQLFNNQHQRQQIQNGQNALQDSQQQFVTNDNQRALGNDQPVWQQIFNNQHQRQQIQNGQNTVQDSQQQFVTNDNQPALQQPVLEERHMTHLHTNQAHFELNNRNQKSQKQMESNNEGQKRTDLGRRQHSQSEFEQEMTNTQQQHYDPGRNFEAELRKFEQDRVPMPNFKLSAFDNMRRPIIFPKSAAIRPSYVFVSGFKNPPIVPAMMYNAGYPPSVAVAISKNSVWKGAPTGHLQTSFVRYV